MALQALKGFKDVLPGESDKWAFLEQTARKVFENYGYAEIKTPILERTELFARSIGTATDIVEKEMYTFTDRSGDSITLRPEATASVLRAFIEHHLHTLQPIQKLFSIGPMFRHERPQKGRLRQFHQINAECLGSAGPFTDAEIILLLVQILKSVGLADVRLRLNSLGCPACRPSFTGALQDFFEESQQSFCEDCRRRIKTNPLRVFDCKVERCQEYLQQAPAIPDFNCPACRDHFQTVQDLLADWSVPVQLDPRLVRGLDYYCRTTFEVSAVHLGAQDAVAGGGRYDGLVKTLGGPDLPAIGFAIGIERAAMLLAGEKPWTTGPFVFLAALGEPARRRAFHWLQSLREQGVPAEMEPEEKSLKSQFRRADKLQVPYVVILGSTELEKGRAVVRLMADKTQEEVPLPDLVDFFISRYNK
ncbi:MAG: histidine--tRNA ligase, partial [Deltaproteobacteria bacterium]|nr:histidine--tRNA ligase [Deltaproteobacteria bacterium]